MKNEESKIQRAIIKHIKARGVPDLLCFHVANAPKHKIHGANLKAMGSMAGVYDLLLFHRGLMFALEIKTDKGRVSEAQEEFELRWLRAGWAPYKWAPCPPDGEQRSYACVVYGLDHALDVLSAWGLITGE